MQLREEGLSCQSYWHVSASNFASRTYLTSADTRQKTSACFFLERIRFLLMDGDICTCDYGPIEHVATDSDGFCVSFESSELDKIEQFFEEFGFVVVRDVVPVALRAELVADVWRTAQFEDGNAPVDLESVDWPNDVYRSKYNTGKGSLYVR